MIFGGVLALALALESVAVYKLSTSQKTIYMPPFPIEKEVSVQGNKVSFSYLETIGKLIANTLFNITPANAQQQLYSLLVFAAPEQYSTLKTTLKKQIDYYIDNELSTIFYPTKVFIKNEDLVVSGYIRDVVGDKVIRGTYAELWITYRILDNGRFEFTNLERKNEKTNHQQHHSCLHSFNTACRA
eukprot:TRINITY_DN91955_c0_g1_i1.p1 TRINITY_DN91955_c0_g1~~TRINITY_DN91955_c0_g1_i1.p1  ORF type:complete len:186 (-),score=11.44 TRINITY_DN91955_c0_g1_i1:231-788(-)